MPRRRFQAAALCLVAFLGIAVAWASWRERASTQVSSGSGPQYGGTLVFLTERSREKPPGWDVEEAASASAMVYVNPYEEYLLGVDVQRYGPRGTNEFPFAMAEEEVPEKYLKGMLAEGWEVTTKPLGVTFHIRKGVMWTGNPRIGMAQREFTAQDAAFVLNRYSQGKQASKISQFIAPNTFRAIDRYTLRVDFTRYNASWAWLIGYALYSPMYPPEVVKAGARDWRNAVGTGPFILSKYVQGSYVSYRRNPNWWNRDQVIDGKMRRVPFIAELVFPLVTSLATQLAAIRTGQVDIATAVPTVNLSSLRTTPMHIRELPSGRVMQLLFNSTRGPERDRAFRRAIIIAINEQAIVDAVMPGGTTGGSPFSRYLGNTLFTPIEQMPRDTAELYGHDSDAARRMIERGGYKGVDFPIYYSNADGRAAQGAALMADQLTRIGIKPILTPTEPAILGKYQTTDTSWEGMLIWFASNSKIGRGVDNLRSLPYTSYHQDRGHNDRMNAIMAITDGNARDALLKKEAVYMIDQAGVVAVGEEPVLTVWWPWVKNYHGEVEAGFNNYNPMFSTLWIDAGEKAKMGY